MLCCWARHFTPTAGTGELNTGVAPRWTISHPRKGGGGSSRDKQILLVTSCYGSRDKLQPDGPLGSYADFTLYLLNSLPLRED